jgi:hypothetical protein
VVLNEVVFFVEKISSSCLYISYWLTNHIKGVNEEASSIGAAYTLTIGKFVLASKSRYTPRNALSASDLLIHP